jgi:type VI protein secretion system component VasK
MTRWMTRPRLPPPPPSPRPAAPAVRRGVPPDDPITQELNSLIAEANRRLAISLPRTEQGEIPTVATLPLYLVVGRDGAGKTTAVLRSGVDLRLLAGEAVHEDDVVPTRLCNLWYAEGALFADLSSRIFTESSDTWERVLRVFNQPLRQPRWKRFLLRPRGRSNFRGRGLSTDNYDTRAGSTAVS